MKLKLIAIGKTDENYIQQGIAKYSNRLLHYASFEFIVLPDVKNGGKLTIDKLKEEEGKLVLHKLNSNDYLVLLDEHGKQFTSVEFSVFLQKKMNSLSSNLVFLIGGPYGFCQEIMERANEKISLSKMTFSHQMVRVFFVEQLYRGFTILKGEKYHHE